MSIVVSWVLTMPTASEIWESASWRSCCVSADIEFRFCAVRWALVTTSRRSDTLSGLVVSAVIEVEKSDIIAASELFESGEPNMSCIR